MGTVKDSTRKIFYRHVCAGAVPAPCEAPLLHAGRGRHQGRPQGIAHRHVDPDPHGSSLLL